MQQSPIEEVNHTLFLIYINRFHDFKIPATPILKQEVNPKIVSERLGHTNICCTMDTYTHVLANIQKKLPSKFMTYKVDKLL